MFKNRSFVMKFVKDPRGTQDEKAKDGRPVGSYLLDFAVVALFGTAVIVAGYVAADTIRQVVVHTAKVKIK